MRLAGKVALITGAAAGIGRGCAQAFMKEGATAALVDVDEEALSGVLEALGEHREQAAVFPADVSNLQAVETAVQQTIDRWGRIDILLSNAGIGGHKLGDGPVHACSLDAWEMIMSVNLRGTFLMCKAVLPYMMAQGSGSIITMASVLGVVGTQGLFDTHAYATSKAGIIGLTRAIAAHYARNGIRANALAPGLIDTQMAGRTKSNPALLEQVAFWQPLGPLGTVEDVAAAAIFLGSDEARFITGMVLSVDGGWTAQ